MKLRIEPSSGTVVRRLPHSPGRHRHAATRRAVIVTGAAVTMGVIGSACGSTANASPGWCEAVGHLDAAIAQIGQADPESNRSIFAGLDDAANVIGTRSPDSVRQEGRRIQTAIVEAAETGQPTLFDGATADAMAKLHAFAAADCDYESVSITAKDYEFTGMPAEVPSGRIALAFENASDREDHELVLFRKSDGVDGAMVDLLALPEEEAMTKAMPVAFVMAGPGQENGLILDLEPGNYGIVCFVPVGGNEEAAPHFVHGMVDDFVVG